ncbi:hypothetical protein BX616_009343 [Lobosporangium transversale]|nr:hypothetical protein BX616_009343 [Lobosporangium transversale]
MSWQLKNKRFQATGTGNLNTSGIGTSHGVGVSSPTSATGHHLPLHLEGGEDIVRQSAPAASQTDTQKTAFMRWVNVHLATTTTYGPMTSIEKDLRDGKRLVGLLEVVSKEPLKPERGNMRIHQMANVSKALSFLEKKTDEPLGRIGNEDIVDGNVKLTLGLIWIIIYRFQIQTIANNMTELYPSLIEEMNMEDESNSVAPISTQKGKRKGPSQHQVDAKQALLRWVRYQLEDYSDIIQPIQDFHRSWRTGVAFAALIHRHDPEYIPDFYPEILQMPHETVEQWRSTLTRVFDIAYEKLSIPRLLDPKDLVDVETPDERSLMTYVSEYYLVMAKHQQQQDPALAECLQALRVRAKEERLAVAGEDQQAAMRRVQEEEERKKQEELEELERIRLRRMEIEGWSIRAVEKAREEEEARRKRREEEEAKSLARKLRREQREREQAMLLQQANGGKRQRSFSVLNSVDSGIAELDSVFITGKPEPMDPEELKRRQIELDEKLSLYLQESTKFLERLQRQEEEFPEIPDTSKPLDRSKDIDPFNLAVEQSEEEQLDKQEEMTRLQSVRDELLDHESPELTAEQSTEVDKMWWSIDTTWNNLNKRISEAKNIMQELQWIVECSQEIERILGDVQRFEEQLQATAEKRLHDSPQDRSQLTLLDHQDSNLLSIRTLLKKYVEILSTLLDSNTYTVPEHLEQQKAQVSSERLPKLDSSVKEAENNLRNDRLLSVFLSTFDLSQEWIQKSSEWLATLHAPSYVLEDVWATGETVKEYLARDQSRDDNLDQYRAEANELKAKLDEEQARVIEFKSTTIEKLDQDSEAVIVGMAETNDATAQRTTGTVQDMTQEIKRDLERVEDMLPKELERCAYAMRVLDYLFAMRSTLSLLETAFHAVNSWVLTQPSTDVETAVSQVEDSYSCLEKSFKTDKTLPIVWEAIQIRHAAVCKLVFDLRSTFVDKQNILKADQKMKEFLKFAGSCQTTLREFRSKLYADAPLKDFTLEDEVPFTEYKTMVKDVGDAVVAFEAEEYIKFNEMASETTAAVSVPGSKHDPIVVQSRVTSVNRLLSDTKALQVDRERDIVTIAECRRVAGLLKALRTELSELESRFAAFEVTDASQKNSLGGMIERYGQLSNEFVLHEQSKVYRHINRDPSCIVLLKEIKEHLVKIQQAQTILQAGLEVGEQWNILWDQFIDRVETLEQYLDKTEKGILERGIATADGLADGDIKWRKSEDELHDVEEINHQTLTSLKEFQRQRMLELSNLKVALHQAVQLSGGIESLDQIRMKQYHEAEQHQQRLREHLQRLYLLNRKEGFQLEILGQRLVWSQQTAESKKELGISISACQDIVEDYADLLEKCDERNGTADLNPKTLEQLKHQLDQVTARVTAHKEASFDVSLTIYASLAELATTAAPGETESTEKRVPPHLEAELLEFKSRYELVELHIEYIRQVVGHAAQAVEYVRRIDAMDSDLLRMATELKADKEADPTALDRLEVIRAELQDLTSEANKVVEMPKPSEKIIEMYSSRRQPNRACLEKVLRSRLARSNDLNRVLDSLLSDFKALLAYQNGLRKLLEELNDHSSWVGRSNQKVQKTHDQIKQMFKSWPGDELEKLKLQAHDSMMLFDVDEQVVVDELDVLMADMDREFTHVQTQKAEFLKTKQKVELALCEATTSSKQLQMELEWCIDHLARSIQQLETDIRFRSLQLQALEKRAIWEKEIEVARSWFKDFAKAVIIFAREQAKWKANHKEFDDTSSMRSYRTTASRMVIDRLGRSVLEFDEQVEIFETESRPRVDKAWSDLCSALSLIARSVPDEFQGRQCALGDEFEEIREQVAYSTKIVTQRKSLEEMAMRLEELENEYGNEVGSIKSGWTAHVPIKTKPPKKQKGWSKFQAKVKKLTRKQH